MENEVLELVEDMCALTKMRTARLDELGLLRQRDDLVAKLATVNATIASVSGTDDGELFELEERVKAFIMRLEKPVESPHGRASYTNGYYRYTYNAKTLNVAVEANPDLKWLLEHRKETVVQPRVKVIVFRGEET